MSFHREIATPTDTFLPSLGSKESVVEVGLGTRIESRWRTIVIHYHCLIGQINHVLRHAYSLAAESQVEASICACRAGPSSARVNSQLQLRPAASASLFEHAAFSRKSGAEVGQGRKESGALDGLLAAIVPVVEQTGARFVVDVECDQSGMRTAHAEGCKRDPHLAFSILLLVRTC